MQDQRQGTVNEPNIWCVSRTVFGTSCFLHVEAFFFEHAVPKKSTKFAYFLIICQFQYANSLGRGICTTSLRDQAATKGWLWRLRLGKASQNDDRFRRSIPDAPWCWNIYQHLPEQNHPNVGKYAIHEAYGHVNFQKKYFSGLTSWWTFAAMV